MTIFGALGLVVLLLWLACIVLLVGYLARRGRRRAFRRGTHPLRLLPWYLGGLPEADVAPPDARRGRRGRRR
jgi:cytochrome c oxidase assembly factor CtaG